jgi:hypothetical protein
VLSAISSRSLMDQTCVRAKARSWPTIRPLFQPDDAGRRLAGFRQAQVDADGIVPSPPFYCPARAALLGIEAIALPLVNTITLDINDDNHHLSITMTIVIKT